MHPLKPQQLWFWQTGLEGWITEGTEAGRFLAGESPVCHEVMLTETLSLVLTLKGILMPYAKESGFDRGMLSKIDSYGFFSPWGEGVLSAE